MKSTTIPILHFESKKKWEDWLSRYHDRAAGMWMKIPKKGSGIRSITYPEAVEVALSYGWIDGQKGALDEHYWLQKFTPRAPNSIWSKTNQKKAEKLIDAGEMKPAGLKAIEQAKKNGSWDAAYEGQQTMPVPDDFQTELDKNPRAKAFFSGLNSTNRYAILFRIHNAKKTDTRLRRIRQFVEMLERNEKLYP